MTTVSKNSVNAVHEVIKDSLKRATEIRTYEVWYACLKANLNLDYKTVGNALRVIMEKLTLDGTAVKVKLGCWRITPKEKEVYFIHPPHPSDSKLRKEIDAKCELVRLACKKDRSEMNILDQCADKGITIQTFLNYLECRKNMQRLQKSEGAAVLSPAQ